MLIKLALNNVKENWGRSLLSLTSITVAIAALTLFMGLNEGIKSSSFAELEKENPLDQITVRAKPRNPGVISLLSKSDSQLNQEAVDEISKILGVKNIYKEIQFNNFASLEAELLGFGMITDSLLFGVPKEFIANDLSNPEAWNSLTEPYPTVIPRKLLDMYNSLIAMPQGLPTIDEKTMLGKEISLYPNYSTFFPVSNKPTESIKLKVAGFSNKVNLVGATLPYELIEKLNEKYGGGNSKNINGSKNVETFLELFVEAATPDQIESIAAQIEGLGYTTDYYQKNLKDVTAKLTYISTSLGVISLIIILLSAFTIISNFLASVIQRKIEIGLFRALGATKFHIKKIILIEAGLTGFVGSLTGLSAGLLSSLPLNQNLAQKLSTLNFHAESIFTITPPIISTIILFGTLISLSSAYFPARKAANMNPFQALK